MPLVGPAAKLATGGEFTETDTDTLLFAPTGSDVAEETVEVLVHAPPVRVVAVMVVAAVAPLFSVPRTKEITPLLLAQVPWLVVAETKVSPAGKASVTTTVLAAFGPRLVAVIAQVRLLPGFRGLGETDWPMARFATLVSGARALIRLVPVGVPQPVQRS